MSILNPERQAEIASIRSKVLAGTASIEEMRRAVVILREGRMAAQAASAAKGRSKAPVDVDALFNQLDAK
jgi:hypothetical protein